MRNIVESLSVFKTEPHFVHLKMCIKQAFNYFSLHSSFSPVLRSHYDVVDGDVDELDEEADEAHDGKSDGGGDGNLGELFSVGLGAPLHQSDRVLGELLEGLCCCGDLVHPVF